MASSRLEQAGSAVRQNLVGALASCATEADIVQVLYAELQPLFGYDVVNMQVLEREGWYHSLSIEQGVLQDVRRRRLETSPFGSYFDAPKLRVHRPDPSAPAAPAGGPPGRAAPTPRTSIWAPVFHRGQPIGAVVYQFTAPRAVAEAELELLTHVHGHLGVLVNNAYLNQITRNQEVSLTALNSIARALSSTLDELGVVAALHATIAPLLPVDVLELAVPDEHVAGRTRVLRQGAAGRPMERSMWARARALSGARRVFQTGRPHRRGRAEAADPPGLLASAAWVPILEGGEVTGVLSIQCGRPDAYEESTLAFLEQVADEAALALRNARSYAAIESQRRRLEVVNAVGRRLASSLDRWAIVRTLREELSRFLDFDLFSLATVVAGPDGPMGEAYVYDSGQERTLAQVPLAAAGPSREAFESGRPVLIRRSPWARPFEASRGPDGAPSSAGGAFIAITRPGHTRRVAARSIVWVPVRHGEKITALLSLQSYRADVFSDWHVQLLQDVAAHVSLALANADHYNVAQTERRRLEALHVLEMGVAGAADERQIAEAVFSAARGFLSASHVLLVYLDAQGRLTGYDSENGEAAAPLAPKAVEDTRFFRRLLEAGATIAEQTPPAMRRFRPGLGWPSRDRRLPAQVVWVPVAQAGRVVGAISAQRYEDEPFEAAEVQLLESAAPVVGIALRTVRLHRANELALAHSVRIQELAALAGHHLAGVVKSVAEQARTMLDATGAACWAFDDDGRVTAEAVAGDPAAAAVLGLSGRGPEGSWAKPPASQLTGSDGGIRWTLIPLWYADRLIGGIGSLHGASALEAPTATPVDFARHAAIAMENARLAAETRGRIHTLEAVAAFTDLDLTQPEHTRAEIGRLIERALSASRGALWLLEGDRLVRLPAAAAGGASMAVTLARAPVEAGDGVAGTGSPGLLRELPALPGDLFATPVVLNGGVVGMLTVDAGAAPPGETRRLMSVLAGQVAVVLGRLQLVAALDRQARMMEAILSHSPVGVILEDAEGRIVYANPEIEEIYGLPAERLAGTPAEQLLREAGTMAEDPEGGPGAPLELRLKDGGAVIEVRRVPIPGSDDQPSGVLTLHEDVTQERMALEAKDLMLRAIGHEVRSPAAAMRSTIAGLLQWDRVMDSEQRHALIEEAYEQSERLLSLVENQLIIAKLETRRFVPNRAPVPLHRSLDQVMAVLRNRYGQRTGVVEARFPSGLTPAFCEPTHLDQVLTNLIGNALEYTRATAIRVSARDRSGWLEVTVQDNGAGLPPERLQSLFQKTGPAGQSRARGGLGLGLYLCRLVVERSFGGRLWLESTGPSGTVFSFTVPAAEAELATPVAVRG